MRSAMILISLYNMLKYSMFHLAFVHYSLFLDGHTWTIQSVKSVTLHMRRPGLVCLLACCKVVGSLTHLVPEGLHACKRGLSLCYPISPMRVYWVLYFVFLHNVANFFADAVLLFPHILLYCTLYSLGPRSGGLL